MYTQFWSERATGTHKNRRRFRPHRTTGHRGERKNISPQEIVTTFRTHSVACAVIVQSDGLDGPGIIPNGGREFPHPSSYTTGIGSFLGVKRLGRDVDHPPHLAPRLKKEWSCTSTPPLDLRVLDRVKFTSLHIIYLYVH